MNFGFASSRQARSLVTLGLLTAAVAAVAPVKAGPTLETRVNTAIGAQATFNNSWAQTFEVTGAASINGGVLSPYAELNPPNQIQIPNSGLAELQAAVTNLTVTGGNLDADSQINPSGTNLSNNAVGSNGIVLNQNATTGLPGLRITPGTADSSVIGASIIGTNIGTESLQVTGSLGTTVIDTLTEF